MLCCRNRLISSVDLKERLSAIKLIPLKLVPAHLKKIDAALKATAGYEEGKTRKQFGDDWAIPAIVTFVSDTKATARGEKMCWWKLNDLADNEMTLFLFDKAFHAHWKQPIGSLVFVANPSWKSAASSQAGRSSLLAPTPVCTLCVFAAGAFD